MDKPKSQAVLRQYTQWTNQRHMQYWEKTFDGQTSHKKHWDKTQNGQTRDTGSFETRQRMDKPDTGSIERRHIMDKLVAKAVLRQDTKWTKQRHRQY
jgi:hypothetical protein